MGRRKIQDESEVLRWFDEGRTYAWMVATYREKYAIETTVAMWGNFRRRRGLDRRITWDDELVPWVVELRHRYDYPALMVRKEARRRAGFDMTGDQHHEIDTWLAGMRSAGTVLHYDPSTGWNYVPRRAGIDRDIIREPDPGTARRRRPSA